MSTAPRYPKTISLDDVDNKKTMILQEHNMSIIDIYRSGLDCELDKLGMIESIERAQNEKESA